MQQHFAARFKGDIACVHGGILRRGLLASFVMIVFILVKSPIIFEIPENRDDSFVQDYWAFHVAAEAAVHGLGAAIYDQSVFQGLFEDAHGLLWLYPPTMLVLLAPFGMLSYGAAKMIWLFSSIIVMIVVARALTDRNIFLTSIALISPGLFTAIFTGQLSILFAGLLASGLFYAKTRPILAGICIGLLTVKPQFGLLVPFFFVLNGAWRACFYSAVTALVLMLVSIAAFGVEAWVAFFNTLGTTHLDFIHEIGNKGRVTASDALQNLGFVSASTSVLLGLLVAVSGAALLLAKKKRASWRVMVGFTMLLTAISSPYFWVYDWSLVLFAILLLVYDRPAMRLLPQLGFVAVWFLPLIAYIGAGPYGVPVMWVMLAYVAWVAFSHMRVEESGQRIAAATMANAQ